MDFNESVGKLVQPVLMVWNAIGNDVEAGVQDMGDELDNASAIESCLDADHLLLTARDPVAHALCRELCREHGVYAVVSALSKHLTLA